MKILFICSTLNTGGIETLILRMSRWLSQKGHSVTVLVYCGGELTVEVMKYANVYILSKARYHLQGFSFFTNSFDDNYNIVHAFNFESAWIGARIAQINKARFIVGVYHPQAYCFYEGNNKPLFLTKYFELFNRIPEENILFMNVATKNTHKKKKKKKFVNSKVLPLPIEDNSAYIKHPRKICKKPYKIISVGRLVEFKNYHFGIIDSILEFEKQNINVEYYIYGTGRLQDEIHQYILKKGLNNRIFLMGTVPYHLLPKILESAFAFVGMGTSLVEAAMVGIPAFAMPPWDRSGITFGLLHQLPEYTLGEDGAPKIWANEFLKLVDLSVQEYQNVAKRERRSAEVFSIEVVMNNYLKYYNYYETAYPNINNLSSIGVLVSRFFNTQIPFLRAKLRKRDKRYQF